MRSAKVWLLLVLAACPRKSPDPVGNGDADADTDSDADTDVDTDVDTDTEDTDPGETDTEPACVEDAEEPNDDYDFAFPRDGGDDLALTEDSAVDYWTFFASEGIEYVVSVTHEVAAGNIDLQVYNPLEGSVANGLSSTNNPTETVTFTANQTGDFFIKVTLRPGPACTTYSLDVTAP